MEEQRAFAAALVHATLKDANGYVEGLTGRCGTPHIPTHIHTHIHTYTYHIVELDDYSRASPTVPLLCCRMTSV